MIPGRQFGGFDRPDWTFERLEISTLIASGTSGTLVWTPPGIVAVRSVIAYEDSADPLVGGGGATSLFVGFQGSAFRTLIVDATLAQLNGGAACGWGARGPLPPSTTQNRTPNVDGGIVLIPTGERNGTDPSDAYRAGLYAFADTGNITGTWFLDFEWRSLQ